MVAFILSANNNVKRIRNLVAELCRVYGESVRYGSMQMHAFPTPEVLAKQNPKELSQVVTCGYRAEYLVQTACMICEGFDLEALSSMPLEEARRELARLKGVGPKVADCILLLGCRQADAFPVDIWVQRLMQSWFHISGNPLKVADKARELFGPNCGIIQQALFHAARSGLIEV